MGSGDYSKMTYSSVATSRGYDHASREELFNNTRAVNSVLASDLKTSSRRFNKVSKEMQSVGVRECRDSEEHPNSTPIIIAFDVTGSMGYIPEYFLKEGFPKLMEAIAEVHIPDPQILFMAIGDHKTDSAPIQTGQFESDTVKIVDSLQEFYLEGGGGGNDGESYSLAYLMAGYHTETDSWFKRHKKGFLFTIGDEPIHPSIDSRFLTSYLGYESGVKAITTEKALEKAQEQYEVYHIHVVDGYYGSSPDKSWTDLLGEHVLAEYSEDVDKTIARIISSSNKSESKLESKNDVIDLL